MEQFIEIWSNSVTHTVTRYFSIAGAAFILFYFIVKRPMMFRKIQKKIPNWSEYGRDIINSLITITIFGTVAFFVFGYFREYTNFYYDINEYSTGYLVFTVVWMFFLHDTYFYWMHRVMHHPKLFKWVHLTHHKATNPTPWTSYAFHPLEGFLEAMIVPLIAFTLPVYRPAMVTFLLFQFVYNVYGHLGFELYPKGFHKTWIGRWVNTSVAHNLHHKKFDGNYGLYFLFWDRMMGTLRSEYDETFEKSTTRERELVISESVNS